MFGNLEHVDGYVYNPYAGKVRGEWKSGGTSIEFLNKMYGHHDTIEEAIENAESEGLKRFFVYLKDEGILI